MRSQGLSACLLIAVLAVALGPPAGANAAFDADHDLPCERSADIRSIGPVETAGVAYAWGATVYNDFRIEPRHGFGYDVPACKAYKHPADGGSKGLDYLPTTYAGIQARLGYPGSSRTLGRDRPDVALIDVPPTAEQLIVINEGGSVPDPPPDEDDAILHSIPVAQQAAVIAVRLPDGCELPSSSARQLSRARLEGAFSGNPGYDQWGELFPVTQLHATSGADMTDEQCWRTRFVRVVPREVSGMTVALKDYLQRIANLPGSSGVAWRQPLGADRQWPGPVAHGPFAGDAGVLAGLSARPQTGAIGYADLATARREGYGWDHLGDFLVPDDRTLWLRVQHLTDNGYASPARSDRQADGLPGARCTLAEYGNRPTTTAESWSAATANATTRDYPLCRLVYALAWEDPTTLAPAYDAPQSKARGAKDFVGYAVGLGSRYGIWGQRRQLHAADYAPLPANLQDTAQFGANALTWGTRP